ncbi:MAG: alpha/beta fold hydrolase [Candidatus Lokiarchaeota archaeon]|nr:alpha/beta fold hydrolase [Candidatus Lokiarchaeota archaeon]
MHTDEFMVKVHSDTENILIEARLFLIDKNRDYPIVCVICHPYSQWGGSMNNNLVVGVRNQLVKSGYPCITFNFRGVGKSTGKMGTGVEEQQDLQAICTYAQKIFHFTSLFLIGYSYGGLICLSSALHIENLTGMSLISYPIGFVPHIQPDYEIDVPLLFLHGKQDDIIPIQNVQQIIHRFHRIEPILIPISTDHFYNGKEKEAGIKIREFIDLIGPPK